jgi:hypothetical protein
LSSTMKRLARRGFAWIVVLLPQGSPAFCRQEAIQQHDLDHNEFICWMKNNCCCTIKVDTIRNTEIAKLENDQWFSQCLSGCCVLESPLKLLPVEISLEWVPGKFLQVN